MWNFWDNLHAPNIVLTRALECPFLFSKTDPRSYCWSPFLVGQYKTEFEECVLDNYKGIFKTGFDTGATSLLRDNLYSSTFCRRVGFLIEPTNIECAYPFDAYWYS